MRLPEQVLTLRKDETTGMAMTAQTFQSRALETVVRLGSGKAANLAGRHSRCPRSPVPDKSQSASW